MNPNTKIIEKFYQSFAQKDYQGMAMCYHPDIHFTDPVFDLKGEEASAMWEMLCKKAKDFELTFKNVKAEGNTGSAHWEATYLFSASGRKVHNVIEAKFEFKEGKIIRHIDKFDFWKWSRMALGISGLLLGWTPFLKNKVKQTAKSNLDKFIKSR